MNNKMTLENFLNAGGLVEIYLRADLRHIGFEKLYFAANSLETARTMTSQLYDAEFDLQEILHREDIHIDMVVERIVFHWNRTYYELEEPHPPLIKLFTRPENRNVQEPGRFRPYYLIAKK